MPAKKSAINPELARLELLLADDLHVPPGEVVPATGELLGMSTSLYYQIRRGASEPQPTTRILLHLILDCLKLKQVADLRATIQRGELTKLEETV